MTWTTRKSSASSNGEKRLASRTIVIVQPRLFATESIEDSGAAPFDSRDFDATAIGTWA